jgi:3-phenylpropionate/trans-cinnamate dioxygenase ferredoxin subunit
MSSSPHWVKISETIEEISFGDNNITQVSADGKTICLARHQDQYYAFPQKCPHASGPLVEGYIDALGNIVCPLHRYRFCLSNGRNVSGEGYYLKHWPVEIRPEGVFVGLTPPKVFGLF